MPNKLDALRHDRGRDPAGVLNLRKLRAVLAMLPLLVLSCATFDAGSSVAATGSLPAGMSDVMSKRRYAHATWNLLVTDVRTGETVYELHPDRLAFTGSVRKLFSVGVALNALGVDRRFKTPVYRRGSVGADGRLAGDLILVGAGDLTLGGRRGRDGKIAFTDFDHNDANNLGTAILTPQDPLYGLDDLARQVRASGIRSVSGDVVVDDRLFESYRVPNGKLLISPILVNENMVDVWAQPTQEGKPARVDWRPKTAAFTVQADVKTVASGKAADIDLSGDGKITCEPPASCTGTLAGTIPADYKAPLSNSGTFVRTFRIEAPATFGRIAFIQALRRAGVVVQAPLLVKNPVAKLPPRGSYSRAAQVAEFVSAPYSEFAKLVLKVSLNLGANLSLSLFGLTQGERTIAGALAAERKTLTTHMGIAGSAFDFPTNGSGSPDSRATARAAVKLLVAMTEGNTYAAYRASLPVLGVDGSLARTGRSLPARGHVFAKTGTTLDASGLKAQVLAGYIDAKSGRHLAFALYVNDAGPIKGIADVAQVFADEGAITNAIFESQ